MDFFPGGFNYDNANQSKKRGNGGFRPGGLQFACPEARSYATYA